MRVVDGPLDYSGKTVTTDLEWRDVRFTGDVDLSGAVFEGRVNFSGCRFESRPNFDNAVFRDRVWFTGARFADGASFRGVTFERYLAFDHVVMLGSADFIGATLQEGMSTEATWITDELNLNRAWFENQSLLGVMRVGRLSLNLTTFSRRVRMEMTARSVMCERATFAGGVQFLLSGADIELRDCGLGPASLVSVLPARPWMRRRRFPRPPRVITISGTDMSNLTFAIVDMSICKMIAAHNLEKIGLDVDDVFGWTPRSFWVSRRKITGDERRWRSAHGPERQRARWAVPADWPRRTPPVSAAQVARTYRALRRSREEARDEPGAADFYYGEMEMRRLGKALEMRKLLRGRHWRAWSAAVGEHTVLWLYWLVSGYGLRAWRALTALTAVLLVSAAALNAWGFPSGRHRSYLSSVRFSLEESISLLRGSNETLTNAGQSIDIVLRLVGPLLFGLTVLALRGRVKR
jgi:uncharacterized protein YjbI with pentapeptide repeats